MHPHAYCELDSFSTVGESRSRELQWPENSNVSEGSSLCLLTRHAGKGLEPSLTEICERCRFDEAKNL